MYTEHLKNTVAIVRSFGFADIGTFVETRLLATGIGHVVVVVPSDQDQGMTRTIIAAMDDSRIHVVERSFAKGGRAWAAMLNAGLDYIGQTELDPQFILTVSNTVKVEAEHFVSLMKTIELSPQIGLVGAKFRGIGRYGEPVVIGHIYNHHLRNTFALYRAGVFQDNAALYRFDEAFDGVGGMEDFAYQLLLKLLTSYWAIHCDIEVPIAILEHRTPAEQAAYEALMKEGIDVARNRVIEILCQGNRLR